MNFRAFRTAAAAAVFTSMAALLSSCATMSPPVQSAHQQARRPFSQALDTGGRLSLRYQNGDKQEALHGSFTWNQDRDATTVTLLSPLGQTLAVITATADGATLTQSGQAPRSASDVDALTASALGWPLPIAGLREWLQGFATDRDGRQFIASPAAPEVVTKDGWHIVYAAWAEPDGKPTEARPRRIDLSRRTAQAGDLSLRIVIDSWQAR
jgi:outer membrane lipoprotein LolB